MRCVDEDWIGDMLGMVGWGWRLGFLGGWVVAWKFNAPEWMGTLSDGGRCRVGLVCACWLGWWWGWSSCDGLVQRVYGWGGGAFVVGGVF